MLLLLGLDLLLLLLLLLVAVLGCCAGDIRCRLQQLLLWAWRVLACRTAAAWGLRPCCCWGLCRALLLALAGKVLLAGHVLLVSLLLLLLLLLLPALMKWWHG